MAVDKDRVITCHDAAGRRRDILVFAHEGDVVVVAPPGETAVLSAPEAGRLRAALQDAVAEAARCGRGDDPGDDPRDDSGADPVEPAPRERGEA